jgi:hypothetical protein
MGSIVSLLAHLMKGILRDGHATTQTTQPSVAVVSLLRNKNGGQTVIFFFNVEKVIPTSPAFPDIANTCQRQSYE